MAGYLRARKMGHMPGGPKSKPLQNHQEIVLKSRLLRLDFFVKVKCQ